MFDDRLATVLRMRTDSVSGMRTQFRQLLDLLGTLEKNAGSSEQVDTAYNRLAQLSDTIPAGEQEKILRESGLRLRNPQLIALLAHSQPKTAASAIANARLSETEWEALIPNLPITARGFLRHRRDLPKSAEQLLAKLGVGDLTLTDTRETEVLELEVLAPPEVPAQEVVAKTPPRKKAARKAAQVKAPAIIARALQDDARPSPARPISAILERIERYRIGRRASMLAPRLPLGDSNASDIPSQVESFDVRTDASGRATAASDAVAPWITGMLLTAPQAGPLAHFDAALGRAFGRHQAIRSGRITLDGAESIAGDWRIDATPVFDPARGAFGGYRCRLQRLAQAAASPGKSESQADRMRQILHELRTPVGAIQGFAEIIQQQIFGPVPHEYRAHAAAISVDAANLLAGFDEIDRLAKLETGAQQLETGESDWREAIATTITRLDNVLRARNCGIDLACCGEDFTIALAKGETLTMCWRVLATLAGALGSQERIALTLTQQGKWLALSCPLPAPLLDYKNTSAAGHSHKSALRAGMFGPHLTLRLAQAEARAAGGSLSTDEGMLTFTLPVLTHSPAPHSTQDRLAQG